MTAIADPSAQFCAVWNWLGDQLADHVALGARRARSPVM